MSTSRADYPVTKSLIWRCHLADTVLLPRLKMWSASLSCSPDPCSWDTVSWPVWDRDAWSGKQSCGLSERVTELWSSGLPAASLTSVGRMCVYCGPFTSASGIHKVGLFFIHRGRREKGRKPREETSPLLRWQTTSRAKFCHKVASARGTDGSKYVS